MQLTHILEANAEAQTLGYLNLEDLRLGWMNEFLTVGGFADYHHVSYERACDLIETAIFWTKE